MSPSKSQITKSGTYKSAVKYVEQRKKYKHLYGRKEGRRVCHHCSAVYMASGPRTHCDACHPQHRYLSTLAAAAVSRAVARGDLKRPSELKCVDCGKQAQCHEHRSYDRVLDVVPTCFSCNKKRGPAHWAGDGPRFFLPDVPKTRRILTPMSDAIDCAAITLMVPA